MDGQHGWTRPCTRVVYPVMIALTLVASAVGALGIRGLDAALPVLAFALLKGQLVGDYFMGLKGIRGPWRWVIFLWLFLPGALIAAAFVLAA